MNTLVPQDRILCTGDTFTHNGIHVNVYDDVEDDNIKTEVTIIFPDNTRQHAYISPYGVTESLVRLYIDAGCPTYQTPRMPGFAYRTNWFADELQMLVNVNSI